VRPAGTGTVARRHTPYAGLISRLTALTVDVALLCAATLAARLLPELAWHQLIDRATPGWLSVGAGVVSTLMPWAYFTLCWWFNGQTIGGLMMGVVVRRRDSRDVSLLRAAVRAAVGLLFAPLWIVGLLYVLWDSRRRAWHDLIFGTVVCYATRK
jgi:uncharacterized RDD family membrane protein YckC